MSTLSVGVLMQHCFKLPGAIALLGMAACAHRIPKDFYVATCNVIPGQAVQVSNEFERSGELPAYVFELQLAMNPKNPNNMVASGIHVLGQDRKAPDYHHQEVLAFYTEDRGKTWTKSSLPAFPLVDGKRTFEGDPTVMFSKEGTAIYLTLARGRYAHRSRDGGKTWDAPISMIKEGFDHWMPAADTTKGPYSGYVYAWGMRTKALKPRPANPGETDYNVIEYQQHLLVSKDDGKTWTDALVATTTELGIPGNGTNSTSDLLIDPKGRLYLPFHSWNNIDRSKPRGQWMSISDDGGATFAKAYQIVKTDGSLLTGPKAGGYPGYALDVTNGPYSGRMYIVWYDSTAASGRWQLLFSHSDDQAKTFAEPKVLEDSLISMDDTHPDLQINKNGVLVVTWYRFRLENPTDAKEQPLVYNRYVTASMNGGKTFLPTQMLSSQMSRSEGKTTEYGWDLKHVRFGDYFNIVADPDGEFHTVWMGGAGGPTQLWYNSFRVDCDGKAGTAR
jgi:hypothetical protein